ncbi:MAG: hemolysin III family protein [Geminicoccaceae bacterium]
MEHALPTSSRAERLADAIVHAIGMGLAAVGCLVLLATVPPHVELVPLLALMIYAGGLMAMLGCSALYNLTRDPVRRRRYRRFDHCGIFLMIAGTYTPFTLVALGDTTSRLLLAFVWAVALVGIAIELAGSQRGDLALTATYIVLGWVILVQVGPLAVALPHATMALLVVGGVLYTVGAIFHHWRSLPFQNAIWHGFVLVAATCHYLAVLREIAPIRPAILP